MPAILPKHLPLPPVPCRNGSPPAHLLLFRKHPAPLPDRTLEILLLYHGSLGLSREATPLDNLIKAAGNCRMQGHFHRSPAPSPHGHSSQHPQSYNTDARNLPGHPDTQRNHPPQELQSMSHASRLRRLSGSCLLRKR